MADQTEFKLSANIQILLKRRRWSFKRLSEDAKVPYSTIHTWLQGRIPKKLMSIHRVARVLNVTIDELCFGGPAGDTTNSRSEGTPPDELFEQFLIYLKARGHEPNCLPTSTLPNVAKAAKVR